ncbi:MAG: phosphoribosylanthranilate isomerase [Pseudomonadota bacterium]
MADPLVKICGVTSFEAARAAALAGADYIGFVFFRKSPRFIPAEEAEDIVVELKQASFEGGFVMPQCVGLFVDAGESEISEAAPFLSAAQFHGHESPARCGELGQEFGIDVIKALPVSTADDLKNATAFAEDADLLLFDAKPPTGADRPGGHGAVFDWALLSAYEGETPFLVAGGLTPHNVADVVASQRAVAAFAGVDVSSGVESAPGVKDLAAIKAFVSAAKAS